MAKKFNMEKIAGKSTIELGKQNMNEASLALAKHSRKTEYVNLNLIDPHPLNNLSMAKVPWLKDNIKQYGLLQPLLVAQKQDGRYQLYAGHQRLMAVKELKQEGEWGETVEIKLFDMDRLKLPDDFRQEIKEKLILRSANIQRGNNYESDADKYVVIQDWKEIYAEFRRCGVEVFEYGLEDDDNAMKQQIKGVKTQNLVSEKLGISHAQVAKFDKVTNKGADLVVRVLKEDRIGVAAAADIVNRPKEVQERIIKKVLEKKPSDEKITKDDILLAEKALKEEKSASLPSEIEKEKESQGLYIVNDKVFRNDIKEIMDELKKGEGIALDSIEYMNYLKNINGIFRTVVKARK